MKWAEKKKFKSQPVEKILESMRQKINEIKRDKKTCTENNTDYVYK